MSSALCIFLVFAFFFETDRKKIDMGAQMSTGATKRTNTRAQLDPCKTVPAQPMMSTSVVLGHTCDVRVNPVTPEADTLCEYEWSIFMPWEGDKARLKSYELVAVVSEYDPRGPWYGRRKHA